MTPRVLRPGGADGKEFRALLYAVLRWFTAVHFVVFGGLFAYILHTFCHPIPEANTAKCLFLLGFMKLAERGRFELPVGYKPTHALQACALNHSAISPAVCFHSEEAL